MRVSKLNHTTQTISSDNLYKIFIVERYSLLTKVAKVLQFAVNYTDLGF